MTLTEAMREIESHALAACLNVASDFRHFIKAAQGERAISIAYQELAAPDKLQDIVRRVLELSQEPVDPRYENPWDTALAIYVWLIDLRDHELAEMVADAVAQAPQCWWASKIARHLMFGGELRSETGRVEHELLADASTAPRIVRKSTAGETILPGRRLSDIGALRLVRPQSVGRNSGRTSVTSPSNWSLGTAELLYRVERRNTNSETLAA